MPSDKNFKIDGIVPIIPTPFTADEKIDWDGLGRLIEFAHAAGACAACLPAYASEFYKLSEEERFEVVAEAVRRASGRIPVVAQVNYVSARQAVESVKRAQGSGATAVCVAVPRLFPITEKDIFRYCDRILNALSVPLIIQDFNPGGPTLSPQFIAGLHKAHQHFRYVKLEEALMAAKIEAILEETHGEVGVLEGWGGMYMLELIPAGICGVMPGLGLTDLLARVYHLVRGGRRDEAYEIFQGVLPQIAFSLQNMELFHHAEKLLLQARGVLPETHVRDAGLELRRHDEEHIRFLNSRVLALLDRLKLPYNPASVSAPGGAGSR